MLSKRAYSLKPSPTLALAAKAKELVAQGQDIISLSVGEPDWDTFENVKQAGIKAIQDGKTKYTPASGLPELRKAIAEVEGASLGLNYAFQEVTVTTGGKFVIFSALQMLLDPGDEVLIPAPYWVSYPTMVELAGGVPKVVSTLPEAGFKLRPEDLERALTPKTKLLIVNSPSNPSGAMYSPDEWRALAEVLKKHPQLLILSDDIYNRLVFEGNGLAPHILHVCPELKGRTVVVNGMSKSYSMTGWRVGWAMGPKVLIEAMTNYQSQSVSCVAPFSQYASLEALKNSAVSLKAAVQELQVRRDFIFERLNAIEGIQADQPQGAFYIWTNVRALMGRRLKGKALTDSKVIAEALLEQAQVAAVPGIEFGVEGYLRISYALKRERMEEAIARIKNFVSQLD